MENEITLIWRCGCRHTLSATEHSLLDPAFLFRKRAQEAAQNPYYLDWDCRCAVCPGMGDGPKSELRSSNESDQAASADRRHHL